MRNKDKADAVLQLGGNSQGYVDEMKIQKSEPRKILESKFPLPPFSPILLPPYSSPNSTLLTTKLTT